MTNPAGLASRKQTHNKLPYDLHLFPRHVRPPNGEAFYGRVGTMILSTTPARQANPRPCQQTPGQRWTKISLEFVNTFSRERDFKFWISVKFRNLAKANFLSLEFVASIVGDPNVFQASEGLGRWVMKVNTFTNTIAKFMVYIISCNFRTNVQSLQD